MPDLGLANRVRRDRKIIREALRAGEVDPVELLLGNVPEHEQVVRRWKVGTLNGFLLALPGVGPTTLAEALAKTGIDPESTMGQIGFASRRELAELLRLVLDPVDTPVEPDHSWREPTVE